jgi:predicted dehydrogenase|tara:strand:+ start:1585 stop:2514 length:930 start_codon:yes stop_codon:yes gene_type:complete
MRFSIIGYKNHASRLENLLKDMDIGPRMWNHHMDNFTDLIGSDAILISSPNDTHVEYIKKILKMSPQTYIFCEKPPAVDLVELDYLDRLDSNIKGRIFFNFNRRFSYISKLVKEGNFGKPVHFTFVSSHGLAFKDTFKDNWRFKSTNKLMGVYGTVAIHYIDMCIWLLGECESININKSTYSESKLADSVTIDMKFKNGCTTNIFVSYVTPFINRSNMIFENAIVEQEDGIINLYENWNTTDEDGFFIKPSKQTLLKLKSSREYYNDSLKNSLVEFVEVVKEQKLWTDDYFSKSIKSNRILLNERVGND